MNLDIEDIYSLYESNISEADAEVILETFNMLGIYYIIEGVLALVPAILGGVVLWKVWTAKTKPGIVWSIITLLFVNIIAGILMLCTKEQDYNPDYVPQNGPYGGYGGYYGNNPYNNQNNNQTNEPYNGGYYDYSNYNNYSNNPSDSNEDDSGMSYGTFTEDTDDNDGNN